jgi:glycosyltransferase involved in cell wall biosynthesis
VRVALLVSPHSFESFYGEMLGLDRRSFVESYRNDFVWDYAAALRRHDVEIVPYVASTKLDGLDTAADGYSVRFLKTPRIAQPCLPVVRHALTPVERYTAEATQAVFLLPGIGTALRADAIDVLYVQEYWTGRFDILAHRSPVPVVAGEHGGSEGRHVRAFKRGSLRRAAAITCQSTAEQRRLRGFGIEAALTPNGVDASFYTPSANPEHRERVVLVVARLHDAQKRISDLVRALALLPPDWRLEIVGSGPDEALLRDLARDIGVADRASFEGFVSDKELLRDRYRRCGVFALPSDWEGLPIALLEAMSCGASAVVTPLRPYADLIADGRNGTIVPHEDPPALAAGIEAAFNRRDEIGPAAREVVERTYSRERTMAALAELLIAAA